MAIFTQPTMLMLYLSIILLIPLFYTFLIPLFITPLSFRNTLYYYLAYIFFIFLAGCVSLICYLNAILKMDVFTWGKTRTIENFNKEESVLTEIILRLGIPTDETTTDIDEGQVVSADLLNSEDKPNMEWANVEYGNIEYVDVALDLKKKDLSHFMNYIIV